VELWSGRDGAAPRRTLKTARSLRMLRRSARAHSLALPTPAGRPAPGITIDQSCVEDWDGSLPGAGNFDADPDFMDPLGADGIAGTIDDDLRLRGGSPCIDTSDHVFRVVESSIDIAGLPWFVDDLGTPDASPSPAPVADLGAHEFQGTTCVADLDASGLVDAADLAILLGAWGRCG